MTAVDPHAARARHRPWPRRCPGIALDLGSGLGWNWRIVGSSSFRSRTKYVLSAPMDTNPLCRRWAARDAASRRPARRL